MTSIPKGPKEKSQDRLAKDQLIVDLDVLPMDGGK